MAKLAWDKTGERLYETGVSNVALFVMSGSTYGTGVAWNGVTAVNESPSGAEANAQYADNIKYLNLISNEDYAATIEAFTYPEEFEKCEGVEEIAKGITVGQQGRATFGLAYKTLIGNDSEGTDHGYKLHLVYNCTAAPTSRDHSTVNDSPEASTFSWEISTTPVEVPGKKPSAQITIDSTKAEEGVMAKLEKYIYGDTETEPKLPLPSEIAGIIAAG